MFYGKKIKLIGESLQNIVKALEILSNKVEVLEQRSFNQGDIISKVNEQLYKNMAAARERAAGRSSKVNRKPVKK